MSKFLVATGFIVTVYAFLMDCRAYARNDLTWAFPQGWNELKALAKERHQNVPGLLTEAITEYVRCKRVRPEVLNRLEVSTDKNKKLGKLLAQ